MAEDQVPVVRSDAKTTVDVTQVSDDVIKETDGLITTRPSVKAVGCIRRGSSRVGFIFLTAIRSRVNGQSLQHEGADYFIGNQLVHNSLVMVGERLKD